MKFCYLTLKENISHERASISQSLNGYILKSTSNFWKRLRPFYLASENIYNKMNIKNLVLIPTYGVNLFDRTVAEKRIFLWRTWWAWFLLRWIWWSKWYNHKSEMVTLNIYRRYFEIIFRRCGTFYFLLVTFYLILIQFLNICQKHFRLRRNFFHFIISFVLPSFNACLNICLT